MFDEVDRKLQAWVRNVVADSEVSFAAPGQDKTERDVGLYLFELVEDPPPRGTRAAPFRVILRYLVTTWGDPAEAHRRLGELAFAALADAELSADISPPPAACWAAFGIAPRPAFILQAKVHRDRDVVPAPPVTEEIVLHVGPVLNVRGVVLGPGDLPVAGASVRVPPLGKRATTDAKGRFQLSGLPASPPVTRLVVQGKGREQIVTSEKGFTGDAPVTIHIHPLEG